jgi:hypothetical protein
MLVGVAVALLCCGLARIWRTSILTTLLYDRLEMRRIRGLWFCEMGTSSGGWRNYYLGVSGEAMGWKGLEVIRIWRPHCE